MKDLNKPDIEELAEKINELFSIYDIQRESDSIYFFGIPKEDIRVVYQKLLPVFSEKNYQLSIKYELGEHIIIASHFSPSSERRWINVALAIATIITTMVMGSFLFGADPLSKPQDILKGIPFTIAIMAVLGSHEAGHYLIARKHGMHTSLPYFIPVPFPPIGTMGAVIKHKGPIPNRNALFDVGISGPLIGLFVSIVVTIIGLLQPPLHVSGNIQLQLGIPPLFEFISHLIPNAEAQTLHPVAFAGWVGMLVTALNLIPAGQLDGGHVLRAMLGEKARHISTIMPFLLISLGFYVTYFLKSYGFLWMLWGLFLSFFAGHPKPLNDELRLGKGRMALGILAFILGLLSLTLVPFQMQ